MSRSAQNSETIIFLTAAPRDEEEPPVTESRRPNSRNQMSRKTVYKIVQQTPPPSPPSPEEDEEQREMSVSFSLEETNAPMGKAPGLPSGSQVLRVLPQGASIVLEQRFGRGSECRRHSKTPEPCLDCLEEFVRRKRAEKQRQGTDASSQVEVTMSNKRICSRRSSKSVATTSSVQSYRCPKCMACKSCGSINVTVPIARK
ncbi:hypothetical protein HPB52_004050 [Rhipicephalus sanguineus]|uniref:Uncharacterized protein n=1 Tax=Rhipicephalus sanguineus TaxID=34632 RepID=A0A9D4QC26_RHISA|nr:hypothetical protein HPB52_004050 [Rhipicephalus sanguineus]